MVRKGFGNEPLKDVIMERKRVEEFEKSLCEDCGRVNLVFLQDFFLKILSRSSLYFVGIRGIYTRVRMECEKSGFSKQSQLMTWPHNLTELQVQAASKQNCQTELFVLQRSSWRDCSSSLHASLVCIIWWLASREPIASSSRESLLHCTILSISSHSLTHYPYMIST